MLEVNLFDQERREAGESGFDPYYRGIALYRVAVVEIFLQGLAVHIYRDGKITPVPDDKDRVDDDG